MIAATVSVPISYLDLVLRIPTANRELDILGTEYERCLAHNSLLYWLMRGDLKFFLYSDAWKPQDWANWLFDNFNYVVVIPFIPVFALMLRPTRKISFVLICIFTAIAFVVAVESVAFAKRRLGFVMAVQDRKCTFGFIDQVTKNYALNLIARQLTYKINDDFLKTNALIVPLFVDGTNFVLAAKFKPHVTSTWHMEAWLPSMAREVIVRIQPYWTVARRINYGLLVVMYDKDDTLLQRRHITPNDCPKWP